MVTFWSISDGFNWLMSGVFLVLLGPLAQLAQPVYQVSPGVMAQQFCLDRVLLDDGVNGDHWIDISSAEFGFFKKSGDGWTKLANLRQPARDPRGWPCSPWRWNYRQRWWWWWRS